MLHEHNIQIKTDREEIKQRKLTDIFITVDEKKTTLAKPSNQGSDEQFILNRRFALWLCRDLLQYKVVENTGFRDFWKSLHLGVDPPTRKTISESSIDDMYSCMKNALVEKLSTKGGKHTEQHA